jgi:hypothetical protein
VKNKQVIFFLFGLKIRNFRFFLSNAYGAKIVRLSLCKETQTISLAGKKLLAIFNTGQTQQTTETLLPFHDGN